MGRSSFGVEGSIDFIEFLRVKFLFVFNFIKYLMKIKNLD